MGFSWIDLIRERGLILKTGVDGIRWMGMQKGLNQG
jgi:hypothetical protein